MRDLKIKVLETISKYKMIKPGDKIVAGISGGPDSMCMLHLLDRLKKDFNLSIFAAHLNHQFRGREADKDAYYVKDICNKWGIPSFIKVFDVAAYAKDIGVSDEEAGRNIRYQLYDDVARKVGANKIAVAHNLNDNVETVFMNIIRGSGIDGLKGIEAVRDNIIRPLINIDRADIEKYCKEEGIVPRIDKTNLEPIYGRNKIRLELLPYIENNFNSNIINTISRFSDIVSAENEYIALKSQKAFKTLARSFKNQVKYSIIKLDKLHPALKRRIIRIGIEKLLGSLKSIEFRHIEEIISLTKCKTGAAVMLPNNIIAYVSYENLILRYGKVNTSKRYCHCLEDNTSDFIPAIDMEIHVRKINTKDFKGFSHCTHEAYIDKDKIKGSLVIRNRVAGDVFSPIGLKGSKKLKEYFIDEKIPREERDLMPLIADEREIIWVIGKRISENYKITPNTKNIIHIRVLRRQTNEE